MQKQKGNGHKPNGYLKGHMPFEKVALRKNTLERLRQASIEADMDYSTFVELLLDTQTYHKIFNDPRMKESLEQIMKYVAKRMGEMRVQDTGGFNFR